MYADVKRITSQGAMFWRRNQTPEPSICGTYHTEPTDDLDCTDLTPSSGIYNFILANLHQSIIYKYYPYLVSAKKYSGRSQAFKQWGSNTQWESAIN